MLKNLEVYLFILLNICVATLVVFFVMRALRFDSLYNSNVNNELQVFIKHHNTIDQ